MFSKSDVIRTSLRPTSKRTKAVIEMVPKKGPNSIVNNIIKGTQNIETVSSQHIFQISIKPGKIQFHVIDFGLMQLAVPWNFGVPCY